MSSRSTIEDVARVAGVSVATVSRALRDMPNVAAETRTRVIQVARDLGYVAHPAAASLASGRTRTIGLAAPFYGIWFTGKVTVGVLTVLADAGYDLEIFAVDTPTRRANFVGRLRSLAFAIDGLLLVDFLAEPGEELALRESGMPVVTLGERMDTFSSVTIDNHAAGRLAATHLLERGHRDIGILGVDAVETDASPVLVDRLRGIETALAEAGVEHRSEHRPIRPASARRHDPGGSLTVAAGVWAMDALAALDARPTAVVCMSDELAMGAMGRAREVGLHVPDDLAVVGFDDHDLAESFGLTTIRQPVQELGERIARRILDTVDDEVANGSVEHDVVPVELVVRASSGSAAV